jgi:hypothetical protein
MFVLACFVSTFCAEAQPTPLPHLFDLIKEEYYFSNWSALIEPYGDYIRMVNSMTAGTLLIPDNNAVQSMLDRLGESAKDNHSDVLHKIADDRGFENFTQLLLYHILDEDIETATFNPIGIELDSPMVFNTTLRSNDATSGDEAISKLSISRWGQDMHYIHGGGMAGGDYFVSRLWSDFGL